MKNAMLVGLVLVAFGAGGLVGQMHATRAMVVTTAWIETATQELTATEARLVECQRALADCQKTLVNERRVR